MGSHVCIFGYGLAMCVCRAVVGFFGRLVKEEEVEVEVEEAAMVTIEAGGRGYRYLDIDP